MLAKVLHAFQHTVGSLDAFQRDDAAADRHRALTDVEAADGLGGGIGGVEIGLVGRRRRLARQRPLASDEVRHELVRADDREAARLKPPDDDAQQAVVALGKGGHDSRDDRQQP